MAGAEESENLRKLVLVLSDSLAFVGPRMAHPINDPRLWPNVMASALSVDVEVYGGYGWTARSGWYALTHDPRLWAVMRKVDAVILALGHFDTAPAPLPNALWKVIEMIRSKRRQHVVRALHVKAVPLLARVFAHLPGGGPVSLRPRLTALYLQDCLKAVRRKRPGVPILSMTPIVARPKLYGCVHPGRAAGERAMREWAAEAHVPLLDLPAVIGDHMLSGHGNSDGMHLGWEGHQALGEAMADLLAGELPGWATQSTADGTPNSYAIEVSPRLSTVHDTAPPAAGNVNGRRGSADRFR